jgi:hypothetical protein
LVPAAVHPSPLDAPAGVAPGGGGAPAAGRAPPRLASLLRDADAA